MDFCQAMSKSKVNPIPSLKKAVFSMKLEQPIVYTGCPKKNWAVAFMPISHLNLHI